MARIRRIVERGASPGRRLGSVRAFNALNAQWLARWAAVGAVVALVCPVRCETQCDDLTRTTYVPLLLYFASTIMIGLTFVTFKYCACECDCSRPEKSGADNAADRPFVGGGYAGADEYDLDTGVPRESWVIRVQELKFLEKIGVGNVGVVYAGRYRGDRVAIKRLLGNWYKDTEMVSRFREEIVLMSSLDHPNVLRFVGAVLDVEAGNMCLVTELCERNLEELLHSSAKLDWHDRISIALDIARGMRYLHFHAGIIQRDLKTANILVDAHKRVKIADFGLSRRLEPGRMETYCGTPATMAPEIVNQEAYSQKADVFSFGIILWEILTRREPYKGYTGMALAYAVAKNNVRPEVPAYCPLEYATLMTLSWDRDPEKRPNFTDLVHSLLMLQNLLNEGIHRTATHAAMVPNESVRSLGAIREDAAQTQHLPMAPSQQHMEAMPWTPGLGPQEKPAEVVPRLPTSMRQLSERMEPDQKVEFPQEWHDNLKRMRGDLPESSPRSSPRSSPGSSPASGMFDSSAVAVERPAMIPQPDFAQIAWRYCMQWADYQPPRMMEPVPAPRRSIREDYEVIIVDGDGSTQGVAEGKGNEGHGDLDATEDDSAVYVSPAGTGGEGEHKQLQAAVAELRSMIKASGGGSTSSRRRRHGAPFSSSLTMSSPSARRASITSSRRSSLEATGSVSPLEDGDDLFGSGTLLATAASPSPVTPAPRASPPSVARDSSDSRGDASSNELGGETATTASGSGILASPAPRFAAGSWTSGSLILQDALVAEPGSAISDGSGAGAHGSGASPSLADARDDGSTGGTTAAAGRSVRWVPLPHNRGRDGGGSARMRRRSNLKGETASVARSKADAGGSRHSV